MCIYPSRIDSLSELAEVARMNGDETLQEALRSEFPNFEQQIKTDASAQRIYDEIQIKGANYNDDIRDFEY